jgi:hypothetical protein
MVAFGSVALWLASSAWAACIDYATDPSKLVDLETAAGKGALSEEQKGCLETSYAAATLQTTKSKISRVLLVNAYAYDTDTWAKLVQRHLDEVERSDPNIAYLYAFYLYNRENPDYEQVIFWTEVALERRTEWQGDTLVRRTYQLQRTRAYAAYEAWGNAQKAHDPKEDDLRNRAKTLSREWIDFARSAGRDTREGESLCKSVATDQACGL